MKGEFSLAPRAVWFVSIALLTLLAAPVLAVDISGDWDFKVSSPEGEHPAKLTITQNGEKITGNFSSDRGQHKIEGTVKGDQIQFVVRYTGGDETMVIPFSGKLQGNKMTGEYKAGDTTGVWTAVKAK